METIGIAMSGGVDSSVSASLLQDKGHDVHGFFMKLPLPGVKEHLERVRAVADHLDIPLNVVDMEEMFTKRVVDVFLTTYRKGCTPNPCIICNRQIKFGALRKHMQSKGMEKIATGHYVRIGTTSDGRYAVRRGMDPSKDQSYFLCRLGQTQLKDMIMPLGELTKAEVYTMATGMGLENLHGPESQDICFLGGRTIKEFFAIQGVREVPGEIVTSAGTTIGQHRGLWNYTIGQRRGLGLPDATPWYVKRLDSKRNQVVVGKKDELTTRQVLVTDVQWTLPISSSWLGHVQIRGRHHASPAHIEAVSDKHWLITFEDLQRAVTPGQFAAFYDNDLIVGSGIITEHGNQPVETGS